MPSRPESVEPTAKRFDAARVGRMHPSRALGPHDNEPGRLKDFQVLRDRRAAHIHPFGNLRASAIAQAPEPLPTSGSPRASRARSTLGTIAVVPWLSGVTSFACLM